MNATGICCNGVANVGKPTMPVISDRCPGIQVRVVDLSVGWIARLVVNNLFGTLAGKRIAVLGFAFKADTNDTRESLAIRICRDLLEEGAVLAIVDRKVSEGQMARDLGQPAWLFDALAKADAAAARAAGLQVWSVGEG
jgi:UDPglucose 6-dehydrogenase